MRCAKKIYRRRKEKERALYVRLPHVIREEEDVAKLFTGDFKVNLPRQSSRHCYVIFADTEDQLKNLKAVKNTRIDGKRVIVAPAIIKPKNNKPKGFKKKVVIPPVKEDPRVTKTLFVANIKCGTKTQDLKGAIPGCVSIRLLKPYSQKCRGAMVKMESAQVASEYLSKIRDWPVVEGHKLRLNPDTRRRIRNRKSNAPLKIYDGETEIPKEPSKRGKSEVLDHIVLENKV
ncbi:PREDICTED: uncharacterized protein LOC107194458 [Dufourea novaeangliae]|uniref:RRM domain-containing protein n=1 Tax=Dufourea novaeangliae TaxID=178035 RepID=A0A154P2T9_DUFNO|nr:PREDICTED: uncharacterized protein LOC107194458 [Dufourea novaeangliae]KZC06143.1 hypothetical protein WN55_07605 [Dufourea novaeangliae]